MFARESLDGSSIWAAVIEKAWAKVKGNYQISGEDFGSNAIRALSGVPVFIYYNKDLTVDEAWKLTFEADQLDYIMTADTGGDGDDTKINWCGISKSHSYSILSAFTMNDEKGNAHRCLLMRNPKNRSKYNWVWSHNDTNWTKELIE